MALETITSEHRDLRRISIYVLSSSFPSNGPVDVRRTVGKETYLQWVMLDHTLVRLWKSHAIRTRVTYSAVRRKERVCEYIRGLLPEGTKKGIIELVNSVE
jgi:hypothetical protein